MRAGRFDGRVGVDGGPELVLDGVGRDNVVSGASGLVCVMGIDELETDAPSSEVIVTKENCEFREAVNVEDDGPAEAVMERLAV